MGHMMSQFMRGKYFESKGDMDAAVDWYTKSAVQGYVKSQSWLANYYLAQNNQAKSVWWFLKAAKQRDPEALRRPRRRRGGGPRRARRR